VNAPPLAGIRVVDLTRNVAGPFCTMTLGDLGADVLKIERPGRGDDTREWRPPSWAGYSATFLAFNRNKRSVAIDLDSAEGAEAVRRLVQGADVLVESFRPGSLARRGLDYESLRSDNPRLIYCSVSGFGSRGPDKGRPGYDPVIQAHSGIMSITGEARGEPVRTGPAVVDMGAALWAAIGILTALFERQQTGVGRLVETSLLETSVGWLSYHLAGFMGSGVVPRRAGSNGLIAAPYETFRTADEFLFIAAPNDRLFGRLSDTLGLSTLPEDERFSSNPRRVANRDALHALIEATLLTQPAARWEAQLAAREIPCSRIRSIDQILTDPQVAALDLIVPVEHPAIPGLKQIDLPFTLDGVRASRAAAPPELGAHTEAVLLSLGYDRATIARWCEAGIASCPDVVDA
jgi:crotonobetainyl-CoA:carnitine CoA-transferase CaiB-like acyl-CoA transferase